MGVRWKNPRAGESVEQAEESLEELRELAAGAGAEVQDALLQQRDSPDSATLIGSGKVEEMKALVAATGAELVIFDHDLTPTQLRNLDSELECRILDRTQLILDIFARHARTREGQLQVELAQLNYLLPRLGGRGKELSRLGGGIGTRGPGEQKLEYDRRRIRQRIAHLEKSVDHVRRQRAQQRGRRSSIPLPAVALVGYTNAGKSTLFNRLTQSNVLASSRMFATLDPTLRALRLPSRRQVLISDTVGFIRRLPTTLVKAFRATLEEVREAALVLHVTDASSPVREEQDTHVVKVLEELEAAGKARILVYNKIDRLTADDRRALHTGERDVPAASISALTGEGLDGLLAVIDERLPGDPMSLATFRFPPEEGRALSTLYEHGRVIRREFREGALEVVAEAPESLILRLGRYRVEEVNGVVDEHPET